MTEYTQEQFDECMRYIKSKCSIVNFAWYGDVMDYTKDPVNLGIVKELAMRGYINVKYESGLPYSIHLTPFGLDYFEQRKKDIAVQENFETQKQQLDTQKQELSVHKKEIKISLILGIVDAVVSVAAIIISIIAIKI